MMSKLGIKVYPSEDLKSMKVSCQLDILEQRTSHGTAHATRDKLESTEEREHTTACGKVLFAPPYEIRTPYRKMAH